jgi:hypothetical protein
LPAYLNLIFVKQLKTKNKMKKIFLMAAFAGLLGSTAIANSFGDDKDKKNKKDAKTEKSCAGEKKEGCAKGEKSCCKSKGTVSTADEKAPESKPTEKN